MPFNTVANLDTSTGMFHSISTRTLCLLLLLLSFMISNTVSNIAHSNASNSIRTPSTTIIIEISMITAPFSCIIIYTGIHRCRTAVTTTASTVVVTITTITMTAINTIMIIITSTRLSLLVLLTFIDFNMTTNPIMTTIIISIIANACDSSSDRSSTTATIVVVMVSINIKFITKYCGSYQY